MSAPDDTPYEIRPMQDRLVFLVSTPRAGSTLLMRVLNATSQIYSRPEPHLMTPLAYLGFWQAVDKAPYDQLQAQQATREFVADLPQGEADYWDAARAYGDVLYGRMLEAQGKGCRYFLDKTPANALILPFLARLYPKARFLVLTRHPAAIFASYANSFFDGDYQAAARFNPILSRYVPAMARFLRERPAPLLQVSYEKLAANPEDTLREISAFLDVPFEPEALNYKKADVARGLGDPIGVEKHSRPVTDSIHKWAPELAADKVKFEVVAKQLAGVPPEDLATWGYPVESLWEPMNGADPGAFVAKKKTWDRYAVQRRALVLLRRNIHQRPHGKLIAKVRFFCDVLLRGS